MSISVKTCVERVTQQSVYVHLVPLESGLSYPVPTLKEGALFLRFFVYHQGLPRQRDLIPVFRPLAWLTFSYPALKLVYFAERAHELSEDEISRPIGHMPAEAPDYETYLAAEAAFYDIEDRLMAQMAEAGMEGSPPDDAARFLELFDYLVDPDTGLHNFYRALNPRFFAWLEAGSSQA